MKAYRGVVWIIGIVFCCVLLSPVASAESEDHDVLVLDEVVVTATKSETDIKNAPVSISVINESDIDASPTFTLDEVFRYTPSVQIIRGEGVATVHNFTSIRGIGDKRNLMYIDGVNMAESMSGNTNLSFLPTEGVEKVEILRGPSSALYGGRGMSGVINIMSADPEPGFGGSFKTNFGNYDYRKYSGSASYGDDVLSFSVSASDIESGNYWARDTLIRRDYDYRTGDYSYDYDSDYEKEGHEGWENWNRGYEEKSVRSKVLYSPTGTMNMSFVLGVMDNETGNGYTDRYTDEDGNDVEKYLDKEKAYAGLTGEITTPGNSNISYRLTYHNPESTIVGENMNLSLSLEDPAQLARSGRAPQFYRSVSVQGSDDYEAEFKWSRQVSGSAFGEHFVTLGTEYIRNDIYWSIEEEDTGVDLANSVDVTKDAWSLFAQDQYMISEAFTLTTGLRGDFYDDFDNQVSPKVSLLYKRSADTQYFLSGGYAYNPPEYSQKFGTDWNMTAYCIRTNNPDLEAETLRSVEVGIRKTIGDAFYGSVTAYYSKADDMIESIKERRQIGGSDSSVYMTYEYHDNIDQATMKGIESEFKYALAAGHSLNGNLTYMEAVNDETDQRLERSPNWLGSIAYKYNRQFTGFGLWATLQGRGQDSIYIGEYSVDEPRKVSGFFTFDASLGIEIGTHLSLFADVTNLLDKDYREFTYTRYQPGRVWVIGCEIKL